MAKLGVGDSRRYAAVYLRTMDPDLAAQAIGQADGAALLDTPEVAEQLELRRRAMRRQLLPEDVVRRLARLAFGPCNDCVRLVLEDAPPTAQLDLTQLAEVKRNEKGTVEVKLIDRLAAIEQLAGLVSSEKDAADALLHALASENETL